MKFGIRIAAAFTTTTTTTTTTTPPTSDMDNGTNASHTLDCFEVVRALADIRADEGDQSPSCRCPAPAPALTRSAHSSRLWPRESL